MECKDTPKDKSTMSADPVYRQLDDINKQLSDNGVLQAKIIVTASNTGPTLCYLATTDMTMRYQTATNSIVYGNLSLRWIARPDSKGDGGNTFSNVVTDEANVVVGNNPQAFLSIGTEISGTNQSRYLVVEGPPDQVFHLEADPQDPAAIAIYTEYNAQIYYLEPADDVTHSIIAVPKDRQKHTFPFKFPVD